MLPTLRNRSVGWILKGYRAVNKPELVKKAFALCAVAETSFNLSYESLTSRSTRQATLDFQRTNPELYADITFTRRQESATYPSEIRDALVQTGSLEARAEDPNVEEEGDDGYTVEEVYASVLGAQTASEATQPLPELGSDESEDDDA
ncbi:hypothetical protein FRC11_009831 [Ceratobasidium sp. 423]|nr:hypothetical protein FRC11_009831 [Ceratobasidium sp. 423]